MTGNRTNGAELAGGHDHAHSAGHAHGHGGPAVSASTDRRWLSVALGVLLAFMCLEVVAGLLAHSLALLTDAGHMLTDVASLMVAIVAVGISARPARGAYTYGFARVDALAGQASGITMLLLSVYFVVEAVRHLIEPAPATGGVMTVVALVGIAANVIATAATSRADRGKLSIQGAMAHLVNDIWAFLATGAAGVVILLTGWSRADAVASLVIAALMAISGVGLVRAAGRVFLEAAPPGLNPLTLGAELAGVPGVAQVHDLHVWQIGPGVSAVSAHVLVLPPRDCHAIGASMRQLLAERHNLRHATLQLDHLPADGGAEHVCEDAHGPVHAAPPGMAH
jgi:cobalt-zinc-cadmium efflux system protein